MLHYLAGGLVIEVFKDFFDPSINNSLIVIGLLTIIVLLLGRGVKKLTPTEAPRGIYVLLELLVQFINKFCQDNFGKYWKRYAPYILTLALYLIIANAWGITGLRPPTASVNVTFAFSLTTFFLIHLTGITTRGFGKWFKGLLEPFPFMLPMNIMGELAVPISLGLRLFGNIFSGVIITGLIYGVLGWASPLVTPVIHAIFDLFFGAIQVVVFVMLTTIFISGQLDLEES